MPKFLSFSSSLFFSGRLSRCSLFGSCFAGFRFCCYFLGLWLCCYLFSFRLGFYLLRFRFCCYLFSFRLRFYLLCIRLGLYLFSFRLRFYLLRVRLCLYLFSFRPRFYLLRVRLCLYLFSVWLCLYFFSFRLCCYLFSVWLCLYLFSFRLCLYLFSVWLCRYLFSIPALPLSSHSPALPWFFQLPLSLLLSPAAVPAAAFLALAPAAFLRSRFGCRLFCSCSCGLLGCCFFSPGFCCQRLVVLSCLSLTALCIRPGVFRLGACSCLLFGYRIRFDSLCRRRDTQRLLLQLLFTLFFDLLL